MSTQITYADAQENLELLCDRVVETGEAIVINRPNGKNVVLISEPELASIMETLYLLRSPANATRLLTALQRAQSRAIHPQTIDELYQKFGLDEDEDTDSEIAAAS
jgi:antitoxin YefM